jgi:hypothetical protein
MTKSVAPLPPASESPSHPDAPEETMICTCCHHHNLPWVQFCGQCGAPIGVITTFLPYERILAEGFVFREAAHGKHTRLITVLGIWALFAPPIVGVVEILGGTFAGLNKTVRYFSWSWPDWMAFAGELAVGVFIVCIGGALIYKVTANYIAGRKKNPGDKPAPPSLGET